LRDAESDFGFGLDCTVLSGVAHWTRQWFPNAVSFSMTIDTNAYLSRWACRRLPLDETPALVERLAALGIEQAWVGSFDALLHRDVAGVNLRLVEECETHSDGLLVPFGCVNPTLPDWREDLRRCDEEHGMPGIRLHPDYHGYELSDPLFAELLDLAVERELLVQIALKMEDERTQHPLLRVPSVDTAPLPELMRARPEARVVLLNALRDLRGTSLDAMAELPNVFVEISMLEGVGGIERLIGSYPYERVLFGTYTPFFYAESAVGKLRESEPGAVIEEAIRHGNAAKLLAARA
jgi:predicted TIM-barrel fold metal-dependent hydrolase